MTGNRVGAGRTGDISSDSDGGHDTGVGGSHQGGDGGDVQATGDGQAERTGRAATPSGDPEQSTGPSSGTPDDLAYGTRRTVGEDPDGGAGEGDDSGDTAGKLEDG